MKKTVKTIAFLVLIVVMTSLFASCASEADTSSLWEKAEYKSDTTLGSGSTTVNVTVKAGEKSVTFTIRTDKTTLGDALLEHSLIDGDKGDYGLYVKKVNGITADYDIDGAYWAFNDGNGNMMPVGVDGANIADGEKYELVYTK